MCQNHHVVFENGRCMFFLVQSFRYVDVSENNGTPKSSILIGFSIVFTIHFWGFPPIFGSTPICGPRILQQSNLQLDVGSGVKST